MVKKNYNLLIVDINFTYAQNLKNYLNKIGFNVLGITNNHDDTIKFLEHNPVDLILIDIDINGRIDGIESCNTIYKRFEIPSIFVTSFYDEEALLSIESSSAFGYIIKPFKNEILKVNIQLIMHRVKKKESKIIQNNKVGLKNGFKFCTDKKVLYRNNYEVNITKNEKKLIETLIKHKNNIITHEQLYLHIWENSNFCLNKIRGAIHRLKRKIPDLQITNNYELGYKIE